MNISVIMAHPYKKSFNHAIAEAVKNTLKKNGHAVFFHDLYKEKFDPVLSSAELISDIPNDALVKKHCAEIVEADGIVIIHPNWWGQPPAILKGWIDRVLREKFAYKFSVDDNGAGVPVGLLKAKTAIIFNTSNTAAKREKVVFGDPLQRIWKDCIMNYCGVKKFYRKMFRIIADSSESQRKKWLIEVTKNINDYFPY